MSVVDAVTRELEALSAQESALGAAALVLAEQLDDPENSATSKSMCAKELAATLREIRALAPPKKQEDRVDEFAKRRELRVGRAAAAS